MLGAPVSGDVGSAFTRRSMLLGAGGIALAAGLAACTPDRPLGAVGASPTAPSARPTAPRTSPMTPRGWVRTSWSRDPFALGSYSYLAPSAVGARARTVLAEPRGRLVFAGEATSNSAPATTHGALQSGRDAARVIIAERRSGETVLVVGAGFAGLGAASALVKAGFEVIVVEARDRVGGRASTVELDGYLIDLGPSWIHGVTGNPMTELARQSGTRLAPFDYENSVGGDDAAELETERLFARARKADRPYTRALAELVAPNPSPQQQWAITEAIGHEFGADPGELAIAALDEGDDLRGGDALLVGGYSKLVNTLAGGLDVRLGWEVAEIADDGSAVRLRSRAGAELRAAAAIVTLPVGVLSAGSVTFTPPLPDSKRAALAALPSGLLDKLWLSFDDVFWNPDVDVINFIDPVNPGLWAQWVNGYRAFGTPTLLGFNSSRVARTVAGWSDDEVVASASSALRSMRRA